MSLNNMQHESIMKGYQQTRDYHQTVLEERRRQVFEQIPSFQDLDASIAGISVQKARLLLAAPDPSSDSAALSQLHRQIAEITAQKHALLQSHGFPADYLDPVYTCRDCRDTGYLTTADGRKTKCLCFRRQEITLLYQQSNIQDMISRENFSTLSYEYYEGEDLERFRKSVKICQDFVQNFKQDYRNLFFYGTVGTGKSFLSGCISRELLQSGYSVIYFSSVGLFDTLARYSFDVKAKESLYSFYNDLHNCDLVIIDDLGTEVTNSFVTSQLFSCLNERHIRTKATIISTNLSLEELRDRYSDRIFSRITSNYLLCKLTGPDIRMNRKRLAK